MNRRHDDRLPSQRLDEASERAQARVRAAAVRLVAFLRRNDNDVLLVCCGAVLFALAMKGLAAGVIP